MSASSEIPAALLRDVQMLLAELSGFATGVAKAVPGMDDIASPLAKRADRAADSLRNYTAIAILSEHERTAGQ